MNIDLGCGGNKQPGFVGIDMRPAEGVDIVCDLEKGIPLEDDTVDLVLASHILEHLHDTMFIMKELWRVCRHGAQVAISVPHYRSLGAWQDPTHVRAFTEATFFYFDPGHGLYEVYRPEYKFKVEKLEWSTLGNMEVILRVIKKDEKDKTTQETAFKGDRLEEAIKRSKGNGKERKTKKGHDKGVPFRQRNRRNGLQAVQR